MLKSSTDNARFMVAPARVERFGCDITSLHGNYSTVTSKQELTSQTSGGRVMIKIAAVVYHTLILRSQGLFIEILR